MVKQITVAVADDNPADAAYLDQCLREVSQYEVSVVHCATARETEEYFRSCQADCILLDCRLGTESGLELLVRLRAQGVDTPVIAVSGQGDERVATEAMKLGASDYLPKTAVTSESLERAITNAIEKQLLQRRLREQQTELQSFVSVVAHDLQQPLAAIANNIELIRDYYDDSLDEKGREFVQAAIRMSRRMSKMIDGLLAYSRVGRAAKALGEVDLQEVVESALGALAEPIRGKSATVHVGRLPVVWGEETALSQLFQNLIANAIKFSPMSGAEISVSAESVPGSWEIRVADNGIGIDPKNHDDVFLPFRRLNGAGYAGLGVGLATCKRIADQHLGGITVESAAGAGATFCVRLPEAPAPILAPTSGGAQESLLILDDETEIRKTLTELFEREGYSVESAASVAEAERLLDDKFFDVVVTDLFIPDQSGLDLIERLCEDQPNLYVVAMSGGGGRGNVNSLLERALRLGAVRSVAKPFDHRTMIQTVRGLLDSRETETVPMPHNAG